MNCMEKIKNPWSQREGYDCFGCSPDNPLGLHMEFFEDNDEVVSHWQPQQHYQGWIDTLHGGILATLIDETAAWVVFRKLQTSGMTSKLELRYRKPVSTCEPHIEVRARLAQQMRNLAVIDVRVLNSGEELCAEGKVTYFCHTAEQAQAMGFTRC